MSAGNVVALDKSAKGRKPSKVEDGDGKPSTADLLIELAPEVYRFVANETSVYGVVPGAGNIAVPLRGDGPRSVGSVRQGLIREFYRRYRKVPNQSALSDALSFIESMTVGTPVTETYVRVAPSGGDRESWLDLGRPDGKCVRLRPGEWSIETPGEGDPVFRRTKLIGELPLPQRHPAGDWEPGVSALLRLVNLDEESWPLALGWTVAAMLPDIPCPILYMSGEQGTGKSTATQMLACLFDDNPVPRRKAPENDDDLAIMANAGWCLALDNISTISERLSDALCRIVTGDGNVSRTLYTNDDVTALSFRRPVMLTAIDAGALRGDLAERMLGLHLQKIEGARKTERQLWTDYRANHAVMLGALLHLATELLAEVPAAHAELDGRLPRMADFAVILGALDLVAGTQAVKTYAARAGELNEDVVDASVLLSAVRDYARKVGQWEGPPEELRMLLTRETYGLGEPHKTWPRTPAMFSAQVRRGAPPLRSVGVHVDGFDRKRKISGKTTRWWTLAATS